MAAGTLFENLPDIYELLVNWPRRLAREAPFYRHWFQQHTVRRVLDAACGTGHHAAMFQGWGLEVEGADVSEAMLQRARREHGEPDGLRWIARPFDHPIASSASFDAVICVGNSLALAPDLATVERAVRALAAALRPGGLLVVHLLNLWRLADGPCIWQKCLRAKVDGRELLIFKGVHRSGSRGFLDLVVTDVERATEMHAESVPLLGVESDELERIARDAGMSECRFVGSYKDEPYARQTSADLILVATK